MYLTSEQIANSHIASSVPADFDLVAAVRVEPISSAHFILYNIQHRPVWS